MSDSFHSVINRLKTFFSISKDSEIAHILEIEAGSFSYMRKKGNIPALAIIKALNGSNVDLQWIFYGVKSLDTASESSNPPIKAIRVKFFPDHAASDTYSCCQCDCVCESEIIHIDSRLVPNIKSKNIIAVRVIGDSMDSTIKHGDTVLIDIDATTILNGKFYAVKIGEEVYARKLFKSPNGIILRSDNNNYPDFDVARADIEVLGQMVYNIGYLR